MKTNGNDVVMISAWHPEMGWSPAQHLEQGLTKRELFAAMAMQGFCLQATGAYEKGPCNAAIVRRSVLLSDLLIEELNRETQGEGNG